MPLYHYRCDNCRYEEEKICLIGERKNPRICPGCKDGMLKLQITTISYTPTKWGDTERFYS